MALGVAKGERVGIWAPNCAEWAITQSAAAKIRAILVSINPSYPVPRWRVHAPLARRAYCPKTQRMRQQSAAPASRHASASVRAWAGMGDSAPWGANAGPSRESRTRGTASTRSRPWSAQSRRGGPLCAAWAGPRFACTRRAAGASQVLDGELAVPVEEEGEEPKQAEQEGDHRTGIDSGSEPRDQPLARRTRLWRGTGGRNSTLDF
jgi:hypothetical protein